jgi:hypothetical protein
MPIAGTTTILLRLFSALTRRLGEDINIPIKVMIKHFMLILQSRSKPFILYCNAPGGFFANFGIHKWHTTFIVNVHNFRDKIYQVYSINGQVY